MNSPIFWRLAWKEYRQQRDLMFAFTIIAIVILAIMWGWSFLESRPLPVSAAYHVAIMLSLFYALGCGAVLFAGEHERETFGFLRSLPQPSQTLYYAKIASGGATILAVVATLLLLAALVTQGRPLEITSGPFHVVFYLLAAIKVFAWATLFSIVLRHPLWAVAAAGVAFFASLSLIAMAVSPFEDMPVGENDLALILHGVVLVALIVANVWLGSRWLDRESLFRRQAGQREIAHAELPLQAATPLTHMGRLLWQSLAETWFYAAAIYAGFAVVSVYLILNGINVLFLWAIVPALVGCFAFFGDQWKQQHQYFAERGVAARSVWWARIIISLLYCLPWLSIFLACLVVLDPNSQGDRFYGVHDRPSAQVSLPRDFLALGLLYFAWAQWCSILFRAGMVGAFCGAVAAIAFLLGVAMLRFLGVPDWLGIYPLVAIFLWASWLRAPDWLIERNNLTRWLRYAGLISLPLTAYSIAIGWHRTVEIPWAQGGQSVVALGEMKLPVAVARKFPAALAELQRSPTADELETARLYRTAIAELRAIPQATVPPESIGEGSSMQAAAPLVGPFISGPPGSSASGVSDAEAHQQRETERQSLMANAVERFIAVTKRPSADFVGGPLKRLGPEVAGRSFEVVSRVLEDAARLEQQGDIVGALKRPLALIRFARHYQQRGDSQQITEAISVAQQAYDQLVTIAAHRSQSAEQIEQLAATLRQPPYNFTPDFSVAQLREYLLASQVIERRPAMTGRKDELPLGSPRSLALLDWMPWERERTRRWLIYQATADHAIDRTETRWHENTLLGDLYVPSVQAFEVHRINHATNQAAVQLRLQLLAWRAQHGELPKSLEELEAARIQVPLDPATSRAFIYRPQGLARPPSLPHGAPLGDTKPIDTPFIWAMGHRLQLQLSYPGASVTPRFKEAYETAQAGNDDLANHGYGGIASLWQQGLGYSIPVPTSEPEGKE